MRVKNRKSEIEIFFFAWLIRGKILNKKSVKRFNDFIIAF